MKSSRVSWGVKLALHVLSFVQGRGRHGHGYDQHQANAKVILDICHTLAHLDPDGPPTSPHIVSQQRFQRCSLSLTLK